MEQANFYREQLPGSRAAAYLATERGLSIDDVARFGLGYSGETEPGHEIYGGRLVIPYLRYLAGAWSVVGLKFRRIGEGSGAKYLGDTRPRLFNTVDAAENDDEIAICEGELDALTASVAGVPAVGVPGVDTWRPIWNRIFAGYQRVWVFADGDQPGRDFAKMLTRELRADVRTVRMPDGTDVNSYARDYGRDQLRRMIGR